MSKFEVRDVVCDYGIYENGELKLILNSRGSALKILKILEFDNSLINEARPYNDTNFDKITENEGALAEFIANNTSNCYHCFLGIEGKCKYALKYLGEEICNKEIKEWLQKECEK